LVLTDFELCNNIVVMRKKLGAVDVGAWTEVWVLIVPPDSNALNQAIGNPAGGSVQALIYSSHVANEGELAAKLGRPQLAGMVNNSIRGLDPEKKKLLQSSYPQIDVDNCIIFEEGRTLTQSEVVMLYFAGGGLAILIGLCLVA